jgi:hypothetical protein
MLALFKDIPQKVIESRSLLMIMIGVMLLLLGFSGGITYGDTVYFADPTSRYIIGGIGLAAFVAGFIFWQGKSEEIPKKDTYEFKFAQPTTGQRVGESERVDASGTMKTLPPDDYQLWVVRIFRDGFYPERKAQIDSSKKTWEAHGTYVGRGIDAPPELAVCLVGPNGQKLFEYFRRASDAHYRTISELVEAINNQKT